MIYSEWIMESWLPFSLLILQLGIQDHLWANTVCTEKVSSLQNIPAARTEILPAIIRSFDYMSPVNITLSNGLMHQCKRSLGTFLWDGRLVGEGYSYRTQVGCFQTQVSVREEHRPFLGGGHACSGDFWVQGGSLSPRWGGDIDRAGKQGHTHMCMRLP